MTFPPHNRGQFSHPQSPFPLGISPIPILLPPASPILIPAIPLTNQMSKNLSPSTLNSFQFQSKNNHFSQRFPPVKPVIATAVLKIPMYPIIHPVSSPRPLPRKYSPWLYPPGRRTYDAETPEKRNISNRKQMYTKKLNWNVQKDFEINQETNSKIKESPNRRAKGSDAKSNESLKKTCKCNCSTDKAIDSRRNELILHENTVFDHQEKARKNGQVNWSRLNVPIAEKIKEFHFECEGDSVFRKKVVDYLIELEKSSIIYYSHQGNFKQ